jgi:hypothetical protein
MKAVLLLDADDVVPAWEYEALSDAVDNGLDIVHVAHCVDQHQSPRRRAKFAGYYALALVGRRRMPALRPRSVRDLLPPGVTEVSFESEWEGVWQRIPAEVAEGFRGADVVIKFGMNLLRGPDSLPVTYGVLSYHHGDPEKFRGRPAGFYELRNGEEVQGVIVQQLSDTLDGGKILAKAYSRVVPHSYAQTLEGALRTGVPLLAKALETAESGSGYLPSELGPNFRLPTNRVVASETTRMAARKVRRLSYGLLREKRWQMGRLTVPIDPEADVSIAAADIEPVAPPPGYSFVADPWRSPKEGVYCEALNVRTGKGEIARWRSGEWTFLDLGLQGGHASYPQALEHEGSIFLFPEIANVSSPRLFRLEADGVGVSEVIELEGLQDLRLVDATLFHQEGVWYLFAGRPGFQDSRLELWVAPSLTGPFRPHPSSPVCLDPRGARMAGGLTEIRGRLYRFGQDGTQKYGGRVTVHRVEVITEDAYSETRCGSVTCRDFWGPHTISIGDETWIDFFTETTSPLAGYRRLKGRL